MKRKSLVAGLGIDTKQQDQQLLSKVSSAKPTQKVMRGNSITNIIEEIKIKVNKYLGKFRDKVKSCRSEDELVAYIDKIIQNNKAGLDTETTGLDCLNDEIVGTCLFTPGEKAIYIPHKHKSYITGQYLQNQISYEFMQVQFQRLKDAGVRLIFHNAKFDMRMIKSNMKVSLDAYWDTMLAAKLLNNLEEGSLKYQYSKHIQEEDKSYDFNKLFKSVEFAYVPVETATLYAATDALMTLELQSWQEKEFEKYPGIYKVFTDIEMPVLPVVAEMEDSGVCLDLNKAKELSIKYHKLQDQAQAKVDKCIAEYKSAILLYKSRYPAAKIEYPVNVASPTQLAILLYDIIRCDVVDKKKPRGTGEEILEKLNLPLCKSILEYRGISKLISTYIDKLPQTVDKNTGRIHASFNQIGADCIVGNSYVVTPTGVETIDKLVGDCADKEYCECRIPLINENNSVEYTSHKVKFENVPTIKIETEYGFCLEGTPNHPIRVINKNIHDFVHNKSNKVLRDMWGNVHWKCLSDIKQNDLVLLDATEFAFLHDYIPTNFAQNIQGVTHKKSTKMPVYIDEDFALFLGMFHADGGISNYNGSWSVTLYNEHSDVADMWSKLCLDLFDLKALKNYVYKDVISGYSICSPKLKQLLKFVKTGKRNKRIPKEILCSRDSVFYSYLRGCSLDSGYNGCEQLRFSFINEDDCHAIQQRLLKQGILASVQYAANRKSASEDCHLIICKEHFNKFISLTGSLFRKSEYKVIEPKKYYFKRYYAHDNLIAVPVKRIMHAINTVYDFTLPETHSFLANGFICHNTGRFSSSEPNLQNIPSHNQEIRTMFTASEGCVLIGSDFSLRKVG